MIVLAGDVGGTNVRLALVQVSGRAAVIARQERYASRDFPGLSPVVQRFLAETGGNPERACFAVACTLLDEECSPPNLPWTVNARILAAEIGIPRSTVINDFVGIGHGVGLLGPSDVEIIQEGTPASEGPIALIGAGTGLGHGFLLWEEDRYRVVPSEGGHADFAPRGELQIGLLRFLARRFERVSWERVLSGPGLVNAYYYLRASGISPEQESVRAQMEEEDPAVVISRHALAGTDCLASRALDLFCEVFGAQAGNLALAVVATGGVYLAGGIAPKIVERLRGGSFLAAFRDKGRLSELVSRIPVHVIMNPNVGVLGAAAVAAREA